MKNEKNIKKEISYNDEKLKGITIEVQTFKNDDFETLNLPKNKDLIPGQYEGGIKLWECAIDLCNFLPGYVGWYNLEYLKVLELGCGHGLPGVYFLLRGSKVAFQDYNREVLETITQGYIEQINSKYNLGLSNYAMIDGDWKDFDSQGEKFDIIVSADTIYNIENYDSLYNVIINNLKNPGICFICSKKFYFGVGGGTNQFIDFVNKKGDFNIFIAKEINDGVSNIRQILELRYK
jgi:2-polyprenyl-3-methyl-5-hydroxy-6-metoxy-1,4-benzoquinol methylase